MKNKVFIGVNIVNYRTDLAIEKHELSCEENIEGIKKEEYTYDNASVTLIEVLDDEIALKFGKPKGKYYTIELPEFSHETELLDGRLKVITEAITELLPKTEGAVLVAGLGNNAITPDALGPMCAEKIFSTRHLINGLADEWDLPDFNSVAAVSTGVLAQTGIETAEYIKGVASLVKPKAVVVVDALVSTTFSRLGKTIQLSDAGITPGSGVGNYRNKIDKDSIGVPVIAIGIPTIIDSNTLVCDSSDLPKEKMTDTNMIVTPYDIDLIIERASRLLALSINCALQPQIEPHFLLSLM